MKLNYLLAGAACAAFAFASQNASAQFNTTFPSAGSTIVGSVGTIAPGEYGYFWSEARGDGITETFAGTGLTTVNSLSLDFDVPYNGLSGPDLTWNVEVDGITVGSWSISSADGTTSEDLNYNFSDITGNGTYTIAMLVSDEIPVGDGAIAIGDGQLTLNEVTGVPDSTNTLILLGISMVALAGFAFRKQVTA